MPANIDRPPLVLRAARRLRRASGASARIVRTLIRKMRGGTAHHYWASLEHHDPNWESRTIALASMIPEGSTVLEFGAGRRNLEKRLPAGCEYIPSDLTSRGPDTIVCDLNRRPLPAFPRSQVVVFLGVLEYVADVPSLLAHLRPLTNSCLVSYVCSSGHSVRELANRRATSWITDFTQEQLVAAFAEAGFRCDEIRPWDGNQQIFRFVVEGVVTPLSMRSGA